MFLYRNWYTASAGEQNEKALTPRVKMTDLIITERIFSYLYVPCSFRGSFGVLNTGMIIVATLYIMTGEMEFTVY